MPRLAQLVAASPLEAAIHDAYGKALGQNSYNLLGRNMSRQTFGVSDRRIRRRVSRSLHAPPAEAANALYHLIGALDPLTDADLANRINDGLPETLPEWIAADGLTHLKIKLNGDDLRGTSSGCSRSSGSRPRRKRPAADAMALFGRFQ